ncbi:hypothetical protein HDV05_005883 [Chytridiales sp. JEL 0842]|nr:hypothetical protein HDV05_005883 [Chytridiales sp. JEL 0842]
MAPQRNDPTDLPMSTTTTEAPSASNFKRPSFFAQFTSLSYKNLTILIKRPMLLLTTLLLPSIMFVLVFVLRQTVDEILLNRNSASVADRDEFFKEARDVVLPRCADGASEKKKCATTLMYFPNTGSFENIMNRLGSMQSLNPSTDVLGFPTAEAASKYLLDNYPIISKRSAYFALLQLESRNRTLVYTLYDNVSPYSPDSFAQIVAPHALQVAFDAAVVSYISNPTGSGTSDSFKVKFDWLRPGGNANQAISRPRSGQSSSGGFPGETSIGRRVSNIFSPSNLLFKPLIAVGFLPFMFVPLDLVSSEKQNKLLGALRRMGLSESAFWLSILAPVGSLGLVSSAIAAGVVKALGSKVELFGVVNYEVLWLANSCYAVSLTGFGCAWASVFSRPLFVNLAVGLTGAATMIMNLVYYLPFGPTSLLSPWFKDSIAFFQRLLLFLFAPFYSYGKIWNDFDITSLPNELNNLQPVQFTFAEFIRTPRAEFLKPFLPLLATSGELDTSSIPPSYRSLLSRNNITLIQSFVNWTETTAMTCLFLILSCVVYVVLAWYLNQVIPSLEGFRRPPHFFLTASYWTGKSSRKDVLVPGDTLAQMKELSAETGSVRIHKLSKEYSGTTAVKEFSSVFESGRVYAVLGHNGAGKTSLVNMLSLVSSPSFGDVFMFGYDIREDTDRLQSMISLCPQFDTLYPNLTAFQHIQFYLSFRGEWSSRKDAPFGPEFALRKLKEVDLDTVAHKQAGTFSGGMKRRLSLCLATLSRSAKIVFLDEPTTGLDPLSRRKCWKVIQDLKKDRVVVLTTHSMEEADALGDHVCIMHQARLRAAGSTLFLKNRFGKGYQLSIANSKSSTPALAHTVPSLEAEESARSALEAYVKYAIPGCEVVSSAAGALTVAVNRQSSKQLAPFLKALREGKMDWSISNSTLEEVFLKLCADNKKVTTDTEDSAAEASRICTICAKRPSEVVTLYTKSGVKVTIPFFVCNLCAEGKDEEISDSVDVGDNILHDHHSHAQPRMRENRLLPFTEFLKTMPQQQLVLSQAAAAAGVGAPGDNNKPFAYETISSPIALFYRQALAIASKNARLHMKEVKTNVFFAILVILLNGITVLMGLAFNTANSYREGSRPPPTCTSAYFFRRDAVSSSYGQLSCDPAELVKTFDSAIVGSCLGTPSPDQGPGSSSSFDNACSGGIKTPFTTHWLRTINYMESQAASLTRAFQSPSYDTERFIGGVPTVNIHYTQQTGAGDIDLERLLPATLFQSPGANGTILSPFFKKVAGASVQDSFDRTQADLAGATFSNSTCQSIFPGWRGRDFATLGDFQTQWADAYPHFGLNVGKMRVGSSGLDVSYDLLSHTDSYSMNDFAPLFYTGPGFSLPREGSSIPSGSCTAFLIIADIPMENRKGQLFDAVNIMSNSMIRSLTAGNANAEFDGVVFGSGKFPTISPVKSAIETSVNSVARGLTLVLFLLATGVFFPRIVGLLVLEKGENLVEMMRIQGLGLVCYWVGNYLYSFMVIFAVNILWFVIAIGLGIGEVAQAGPLAFLGLILLWTHAQICLSMLISGLVSTPVAAGLMAYLVYIFSAILSLVIVQSADPETGSIGIGPLFVPPFGVVSTANVLIIKSDPKIVSVNVLITLLGSTLWGLVGCYIHAVRPSPMGIPVDPFFGLFKNLRNTHQPKSDGDVEGTAMAKDNDVVNEARMVAQMNRDNIIDPNEAIRISNLRRTFGEKVAVSDISLSVRFGTCFGLLGPNGSGKTTTLSMITGLLERTSGSITIAGQSIDQALSKRGSSPDSLWRLVGVTPQFDRVWAELTVEEHLIFYSRLRGIQPSHVTAMVRKIAEEVELDGDALKTKAGGLSGGMRRRLAIAISLTGGPKILILDEPTTGLDPETRRQIWKIIDRLRRSSTERCILITTHSMEEADALCTRIGIVCDGELQVLGSQLHLKKKFDEGLKLTMRFSVEMPPNGVFQREAMQQLEHHRVNEVANAVSGALQTVPRIKVESSDLLITQANAKIRSKSGKNISWMVTLQCHLPHRAVDIADVFLALEAACKEVGVTDWGLTETTLEDVFVNVASKFM